jgi:chromosomal replication initiation ATPase DnaA
MRQLILYILYTYGDLTLENLGLLFSKRDHTSILYAVRSFKKEIKTEQIETHINNLKILINSL